jgi:hypothetical protein
MLDKIRIQKLGIFLKSGMVCIKQQCKQPNYWIVVFPKSHAVHEVLCMALIRVWCAVTAHKITGPMFFSQTNYDCPVYIIQIPYVMN